MAFIRCTAAPLARRAKVEWGGGRTGSGGPSWQLSALRHPLPVIRESRDRGALNHCPEVRLCG